MTDRSDDDESPLLGLIVLLALLAYIVYIHNPRPKPKRKPVRLVLIPGGAHMDSLTIKQTLPITAAAVDDAGAPANLPTGVVPAWTTDNPANATIAAAADGMSAVLTPLVVGTSVVTATATMADGSTISGNLTITITDEAVNKPTRLILTSGTPTP